MAFTRPAMLWIGVGVLGLIASCALVRAEDESPSMPSLPESDPDEGKKTEGPRTTVAATGLKAGEKTTQMVLDEYRQEIEELNRKFTRDDQANSLRTLLATSRATFNQNMREAVVPDKTIDQHFDQFLSNIDTARRSFRFRDADRPRAEWISEAARTLQSEVKVARDRNKARTPNQWFEEFAMLMRRVRDKIGNETDIGRRVYSIILTSYTDVLRELDADPSRNLTDDLQRNLELIRRLYPTTSPDQKEKNDSLKRAFERFATDLVKFKGKK
ncbi:MAG: hypothetical protein HS116_19610 [Planctomycetes bacterium]|nr:hypothetical protein [Planctomycetota bacterium]